MNSVSEEKQIGQLARMAAEHLGSTHTPFCAVQTCPRLITAAGHQYPDLVFWLNHESFVGGGFLLAASSQRSADIDRLCACAAALGCRYGILRSARELLFYDCQHNCEHLRISRARLTRQQEFAAIMEQLATLAVLGTYHPRQVSPWNSVNLCLHALEVAASQLGRELRRHNHYSELRCHHKLNLVLARLLALLQADAVPDKLPPGAIDETLSRADSRLSPQLNRALAAASDEVELDRHSAITMHHLLQRLQQIRPFDQINHGELLLRQLLYHLPPAGASAITADSAAASPGIVLINQPIVDVAATIEIHTPAHLALKHLWRQLHNLEALPHTSSNLFSITNAWHSGTIAATLYDDQVLTTAGRNTCLRHLHLVWPGRVFNFSRPAPAWLYQFIYLCGLVKDEARLHLVLPRQALSSDDLEILGAFILSEGPVAACADDNNVIRVEISAADNAQAQQQLLYSLGNNAKPVARQRRSSIPTRQLRAAIMRKVDSFGLGKFPHHYLYDYYQPQLRRYSYFGSPWEITDTFMGSYILSDADGNELEVEHEYVAAALLLASHVTDTIDLPEDVEILAAIVQRYLRDVIAVRTIIVGECRANLDSAAATRITHSIWSSLDVAPWSYVKKVCSLLGIKAE